MDRRRVGKRNKARGKRDELLAAKALGGARFPADSGGPVDVETDLLAVQVKGSQTVPSDRQLAALDSARGGAKGNQVGCAVFVRHQGVGREMRAVIMFDLHEFAERHHGG